jgi:hypothetical protein
MFGFRRFRLKHLLLVLGFFLGQTAALLHVTQHELSPDDSTACQICVLAHAGGAAPAAVDIAALVVPQPGEQPAYTVTPVFSRSVSRPNSRGPPLIPA